jgi:hypothetical protein
LEDLRTFGYHFFGRKFVIAMPKFDGVPPPPVGFNVLGAEDILFCVGLRFVGSYASIVFIWVEEIGCSLDDGKRKFGEWAGRTAFVS